MAWLSSGTQSRPLWLGIAVASWLGLVLVGFVDYQTGIEYRIFPLYFVPLSFAAWYLGRLGTLTAAAIGACSWLVFNYLGGLRYSHPSVWAVNLVTQGSALVVVGLLIATVRAALDRETQLSRTDSMTGLLNNRAFGEAAQREVVFGRRQHHPVTLAFLDLDGFKAVNDALGHQGGDNVLRRVASSMRETLRTTDVAARIGGDEFAVLLPATGAEGAAVILERLRARVADTVGADGVGVTVTVGAVTALDGASDLDTLLHHADRVMYAAKASGKDQVRVEVITPAP